VLSFTQDMKMEPEPESLAQDLDPRVVRTRRLLQDALCKLLQEKGFNEISVQDIADAATVNRATFYAHYRDKYGLLGCMMSRRLDDMLAERKVRFDRTCGPALKAVALTLCDCLEHSLGPANARNFEPHMEAAVIGVLQRVFACGLGQNNCEGIEPSQMAAAAAAWAMYGAARQWAEAEVRRPSAEIAAAIADLVTPILASCRVPAA